MPRSAFADRAALVRRVEPARCRIRRPAAGDGCGAGRAGRTQAAALAEVAALNDYVRPRFIDGVDLHIENGRHPVVERALNQGQVPGAARGERFVPNDAHFADGSLIQIITGPNMSGKSTYLRQVALIVLMAQIGSYVPASSVEMGLVDRILPASGRTMSCTPGARHSWWRWWRRPKSCTMRRIARC